MVKICFRFALFSCLLLVSQVCSKKARGITISIFEYLALHLCSRYLKKTCLQVGKAYVRWRHSLLLIAWNPAKELVDIINKNRTSLKLPALYDSPGLGCMALQYADECKGNCTSNNTVSCHPSEDDFTEVFAPDCGVELPTFDIISMVIVGCHSKYLEPSKAFSEVLFQDKKSLSVIRNRTHTEVGVGLASIHKRHFFWCVLFSSGQRNSSFVLEHHGLGIKQRQGCFSGTNITCSQANGMKGEVYTNGSLGILTLLFLYYIWS